MEQVSLRMPISTLSQAISLIKAGQRTEGRVMLNQILSLEPNNVTALIWMTEAVDTAKERREYLNRILAIEPNNPVAIKGLELLGSEGEGEPPWLQQAKASQSDSNSSHAGGTERTYYSDEQVVITNTRAIFRGKTYSLANVTSVENVLNPPGNLNRIAKIMQ
jgi:hypothetical protein